MSSIGAGSAANSSGITKGEMKSSLVSDGHSYDKLQSIDYEHVRLTIKHLTCLPVAPRQSPWCEHTPQQARSRKKNKPQQG